MSTTKTSSAAPISTTSRPSCGVGPDRDESIRAVRDNADAIFTWDYEKGARPALNKLYEKAKVSMWNGETDLDWDTVVDQEEVARNNQALSGGFETSTLITPPSPSGARRSG
jgi:hypothetical protein